MITLPNYFGNLICNNEYSHDLVFFAAHMFFCWVRNECISNILNLGKILILFRAVKKNENNEKVNKIILIKRQKKFCICSSVCLFQEKKQAVDFQIYEKQLMLELRVKKQITHEHKICILTSNISSQICISKKSNVPNLYLFHTKSKNVLMIPARR